MTLRRLTTVSAAALALCAGPGSAQQAGAPTGGAPVEVFVHPGFRVVGPTPPFPAIDPVTTGQIPNHDAEAAAEHLQAPTGPAADATPEPANAAPSLPSPPEEPARETGGFEVPGHASAAGPAQSGAPAEASGHAAPETGHAAAAQPEPAAEPLPSSAQAAHGEGEAEGHAPSKWAAERSPMPFDIIRTIQFLQDQVSRGNGRAIRVQAMLLKRFGPIFADAPPDVWADARNFRAAVLFVLSGGPSDGLRRMAAGPSLDAGQMRLVKGALAYVDNQMDEAATTLSGLDFNTLEPGLAAHVHLVLGQMKQLDHPEEAVRHLDQARLLSPGGLIEESALRMEVLLVDGLGRHDAADRLARRYFDRYPRSAYAANFEARFATILAVRGKTDAPLALATMLDLTARLPDEGRRALFLAVGRRALIAGNLEFAGLTAGEALRTGGITDADKQRASLYTMAATVGSGAATADELEKIDRSKLHPEDVLLLDAAYSILKGIDRTPEVGEAPSSSEQYAESAPVFDRAQQLLNEVASDLGKAQP